MRIVQVVHRFYPPTIGGLSFHVNFLSRHLASLGHKVAVLTTKEGFFQNNEVRDGYEIMRYESILNPFDNPFPPGLLAKLLSIKKGEIDIIHAHSHLMFGTNFGSPQTKSIEYPLSYHEPWVPSRETAFDKLHSRCLSCDLWKMDIEIS